MVAGLDRTRGACTGCPDQLTSIGPDLSRCVLLNHLDSDGPKQIYLQLQTQLIFIEHTMSIPPEVKQESRIYRIQNSALLLKSVLTTVHSQM